MESSDRSFWGPIIKQRCGVCLQDSGWMTIGDAKQWANSHRDSTGHQKFAEFLKKFHGGRTDATKEQKLV